MRTTIDLNERLLKKLKKLARDKNMTLSKYVESLLTSSTANIKKTKQKKPKFELLTICGELVNSDLDLDRTSALIAEDDLATYKS